MRVLVLCDDYWHPAATVRAGLAPLAAQGFTFDWLEDAAEWSPARMGGYALTLLAKSNNRTARDQTPWVTPEAELAIRDYVRAGHGLLAIHSGTATYGEHAVLRGVLGGVFASHPPQCTVTVEPCADHPLAEGCAAFSCTDEHYMMELDDAGAAIWLRSRSEHGVQPAGWTRAEGAGRVGVLTPGHNLDVWLAPAYQAIIARALRWCAAMTPPAG